jgi:uncharacterized damage-inducible protein DinB
MNKQTVDEMMNRLRLRHGIALRLIEALPEDKLNSNPIPNMRTPAQLIVHLYAMVFREMIEGVQRGEIKEVDEASIAKSIRTKADLLTFARTSFEAASKAAASLTDAQLSANVKTAWGSTPPGYAMIEAVNDEFYHHRGQLFAYARALGATPPDMWDFQNNAAEFQPATAGA